MWNLDSTRGVIIVLSPATTATWCVPTVGWRESAAGAWRAAATYRPPPPLPPSPRTTYVHWHQTARRSISSSMSLSGVSTELTPTLRVEYGAPLRHWVTVQGRRAGCPGADGPVGAAPPKRISALRSRRPLTFGVQPLRVEPGIWNRRLRVSGLVATDREESRQSEAGAAGGRRGVRRHLRGLSTLQREGPESVMLQIYVTRSVRRKEGGGRSARRARLSRRYWRRSPALARPAPRAAPPRHPPRRTARPGRAHAHHPPERHRRAVTPNVLHHHRLPTTTVPSPSHTHATATTSLSLPHPTSISSKC